MTLVDLPRWDVSDIFAAVGSPDYAAARERLTADLSRLKASFDGHDIRGGAPLAVDAASVAAFEDVLVATNAFLEHVRLVSAYLHSYVSTDARDEAAQGEMGALSAELSGLAVLRTRLDAWLARLDRDELVAASVVAADHAFPLERAAERATKQMAEAEEALAAELTVTGRSAWNRLYGDVTATLMVDVPMPDGTTDRVAMSQCRNLARHPDRAVRRAAFDAELAAWKATEIPIAACLNAITGESITLADRRGWDDLLAPALAVNNVDAATLDALQGAMVDSFGDFRRYLAAKARLLGLGDTLAFYDLFAPVGNGSAFTWAGAVEAVHTAFGSYSGPLAQLVERATGERWIDAEPRAGKGGGAFCANIEGERSLVLLNFDGTFDSVQTLAHELGHAYHNTTLAHRTAYQRETPMALAETASIFCETIMVEHGLATADDDARLVILDTDLLGSCQVIVDIHSRFLFEQRMGNARRSRPLSASELCGLMDQAQADTYGDVLDTRHPYMWAAKPHYYGRAFYNWPYAFGLLFGIGLYARYQSDPEPFRDGYDDLLSSTGLGDAASLGRRFGIDITDRAFWTSSLDVVRARIDAFVALVEARVDG